MRYISSLAQMLEETSRLDDGPLGKCLQIMLYKTLADKLWRPFKVICFNPVAVLCVMLVVYLLFCVIFIPLMILSYAITTVGSLLVLLFVINYAVQLVARAIAFPGSNVSVQKQLCSDFIKRIISYVENVATMTLDFSTTLLLIESGRIPVVELQSANQRMSEIHRMASSLPRLHDSLRRAVTELAKNRATTPAENVLLNQLCLALEGYNTTLPALAAVPKTVFRPGGTHSSSDQSGHGKTGLVAAGQCIRACEALKVAIIAVAPPAEDGPNDEDGAASVVAKLKGLLCSFREGLSCSEKLTFPYMRDQLRLRFGAQRLAIRGSSGNRIDAVLILASHCLRAAGSNATDSGNVATDAPSAKGIVLFCSPNAGFFECVSQSELNQSWLGYYCALGYDVVYFNYAGYADSTGAPSPAGVKRDALLVAQYLRRERNPSALIVHGESIGGMAACYVASRCPVEGLVCDRTFASLDSVASRLLHGAWAGYGLKYLGLWSTHVVGDYLSAACPKVVLQDPDDEIIAHVASLKSGLATHVVLGDSTWYAHSLPPEYVLASHLNSEVLPHSEDATDMLRDLEDLSRPLQERAVAHLFACILDTARRSTSLQARRQGAGRSRRSDMCDSVEGKRGHPAGTDDEDQDGSNRGRLAAALQSTVQTIGKINAQGSIVASSSSHDGIDDEDSRLPALSGESVGRDRPQETEAQTETQFPDFSSQRQFLDYLCSLNVVSSTSTLTPHTKLWVAVARIDGGSGQLLGQAVRGGYDGFRAWLCSLLVWGAAGRAFRDKSLPSGRSSVQAAAREVSVLVDEQCRDELLLSPPAVFIRDALASLAKRVESPVQIQLATAANSTTGGGRGALSCGAPTLCSLEANIAPCQAHCEHMPCTALPTQGRSYSHANASECDVDSAEGRHKQRLRSFGQVIPLHCGHNGWLTHDELGALTEFFTANKLS